MICPGEDWLVSYVTLVAAGISQIEVTGASGPTLGNILLNTDAGPETSLAQMSLISGVLVIRFIVIWTSTVQF